ncbi:MAG: C-3',4' desaturase CrtD [Desulfobulbaceae bacterium]
MNRVVVIGSGISGLTGAILLHRLGREVLILEQQPQAGGALHRFRRGGIPFDVGFHYTGGLGEGEILRTIWRYCGVDADITPIPFPEEGGDRISVNGFPDIRAPFSYERFAGELKRHFPAEQGGIDSFFRTIRSHADANPFYNPSRPLGEFLQQLAFPEEHTLGDLIRSCTSDPVLQAALSHPVFLHGVRPDDIGLAMHTSVAHPVYSGMYAVDGGGQAIADAFLRRLETLGVVVRRGVEVTEIRTENGRVTGVAAGEEFFPCTDVVYTGHPALLPGLVEDDALRKVYRDRLREMTNTPSMFLAFGAVERSEHDPRLDWNNFYALPPGLDFPSDNEPVKDKWLFLSGCGLRDSALTPENDPGQAVILMRPASWRETQTFDRGRKLRASGYREWKEGESRKLIEEAERLWNGLLKGFRLINAASPLTFRDELKYVRGAVYGVRHSTDQFAVGSRTRVAGLWLSGQSTLMCGILGASLSALITVGTMTDLESLWRKVRSSA